MRSLMLVNGKLASGGIIYDNWPALSMIVSSHVIDLLAHPGLTYVAWKIHKSHGGSMRNLVTWDVFWSAIALSRIYSMAHLYYNNGKVTGLFYYGVDVYNIDTQESYTVAYVAEAVCFAALAMWKVYIQWSKVQVKIRIGERQRRHSSFGAAHVKTIKDKQREDALDRQKPELVPSNSCFSSQESFLEECECDQ